MVQYIQAMWLDKLSEVKYREMTNSQLYFHTWEFSHEICKFSATKIFDYTINMWPDFGKQF